MSNPTPETASNNRLMIRVLLVDDHPFVRDGIRARLESTPNIHVVGEASSVDEAIASVGQVAPDVVVTDIRMARRSGIELAAVLREEWPDIRVIVLSMLKEPEYIKRALGLGVSAYVLKDAPTQELLHAVELASSKHPFLSTAIQELSLAPSAKEKQRKPLTDRQRAILKLLSEGKSSKDIAQALDMSIRTVETHRLHLRRKLNLEAGAALDRYASDFSDLVTMECR